MRMHPCKSSDEFPSCLPFAMLRAPKVCVFTYFHVCLFVAVLGASSLKHAQDFSSYGERGLLPSCSAQASPCGGFSYCGVQTLDKRASVVGVDRLSCPASREIFPDCESNPACPTRQILNH